MILWAFFLFVWFFKKKKTNPKFYIANVSNTHAASGQKTLSNHSGFEAVMPLLGGNRYMSRPGFIVNLVAGGVYGTLWVCTVERMTCMWLLSYSGSGAVSQWWQLTHMFT